MTFLIPQIFDAQEQWRTDQIKQWITQYGKDYFNGLRVLGLDLDNL